MTTNETRATLTNAAPGLIRALRRAAEIANDNGRGWFGVEDVLTVLLDENSVLGHYATEQGLGEQFAAIRAVAASIVPGTVGGPSTPAGPPVVDFTVTGPDGEELAASILRP